MGVSSDSDWQRFLIYSHSFTNILEIKFSYQVTGFTENTVDLLYEQMCSPGLCTLN